MDVRKAKVEASYLDTTKGISYRLGPGLDVDLDEVICRTPLLTVRDVFNEDNFEAKVVLDEPKRKRNHE